MLYLLDADTLITSDRKAYPLRRFPVFWNWLRHMGKAGIVKVPLEQFEEVTAGKGHLVDWLNESENRGALLLSEEADAARVSHVILHGYGNLNEVEIEQVGRDPFLISYGAVAPDQRTLVTFEVSAPGQKRGKRKIPDVCSALGISTCSIFGLIEALDFTTDWRP